jgi:hypothetical protein
MEKNKLQSLQGSFPRFYVYQFFTHRQHTVERERWPVVRVFIWAFPAKEILHGPTRLGTFG